MKNHYNNLVNNFSLINNIKNLKMDKIILHTGISKFNNDKKKVREIFDGVNFICNQKPIITKIKKSISNFKSRRGDIAGIFVTLRKQKMWNFYHKLISIIIPRIKEFKGYNKNSIDRFGNLNIGINDCHVFPDFFYDIKFGFNINFVVKNLNNNYKNFYKFINFPIN